MHKLMIYCALSLLSGCAATAPTVHTETVTVYVPTPVPCVPADKMPTIPPTSMKIEGDGRQHAAAVIADVVALQRYADKADPLLRACIINPKEKP